MIRTILASLAVLATTIGGATAQTTATVQDMETAVEQAAEWTLMVASSSQRNPMVAFGNTPMTRTACLEAAKATPGALQTAVEGGWTAFGAICLNTRTGAVALAK